MLKITFINQAATTARIPRAVICRTLKKAERLYKPQLAGRRLALVFMPNLGVKKLNYHYRGKNKPTNVLSFTTAGEGELGDIIICPAIARAEAAALGQSFGARVNYLFIHGLLHLLGFDHQTRPAEKLMAKAEAKLK